MPRPRLGLLGTRIDELKNRHYRRTEDAFVHVAVELLLGLNESEALTACIGNHDRAIDGFYIDEEQGQIHILQGKMLGGRNRVPDGDISHFGTAVEWLKNPALLSRRGVNPGVIRAAQLFAERVENGRWDILLWFVTTNGFEPAADAEIIRFNRDHQGDRQAMHPVTLEVLEERYRKDFAPVSRVESVDFRIDASQCFEGPTDVSAERSVVATIRGVDIGSAYNQFTDDLIDGNVRGWLSRRARANRRMQETIRSRAERFWFLNNGVTIVCDGLAVNEEKTVLTVTHPQIVNGGQTSRTLADNRSEAEDVRLLARFIITGDEDFRKEIADGTNTQTAVANRDLRSIDAVQRRMEEEMRRNSPSYHYQRKRGEIRAQTRRAFRGRIIQMDVAAQALASLYHQVPGTARSKIDNLFNPDHPWYDQIFHDGLRGRDLIAAWMVYEEVARVRRELSSSEISESRRDMVEAEDALSRYGLMFMVALAGDLLRSCLGNLDHDGIDRLMRGRTDEIVKAVVAAGVRILRTRLMSKDQERQEFDNLSKSDNHYLAIREPAKEFLESVDPGWESQLCANLATLLTHDR